MAFSHRSLHTDPGVDWSGSCLGLRDPAAGLVGRQAWNANLSQLPEAAVALDAPGGWGVKSTGVELQKPRALKLTKLTPREHLDCPDIPRGPVG